MPKLETLKFEILVEAAVERVHATMIDDAGYRDWTSAFAEGSYYQGSWNEGEIIRFLAPSGDGMMAEIAEHRPGAFISIRHLGMIEQGMVDTTSEAVKAWAPCYENYRFEAVPQGTRLEVELQMPSDFADHMRETWPRALLRLKVLCEGGTPR
ncbi:SRPBCC domain-containing protein [Roseateles sp. DC23W]|uniref:SRPBCC domain-containing protein n=1 Tax=Pelomonas dachongensis TaxID=3299029 RepID=A0ABW7ERD5_9BURK